MGNVTRYPDGTFCWIDLGTPNLAGAKRFYSEMFGWETEDVQAGDSRTYTLCRLNGRDVAAIHEHPPGEGGGWSSHISVDDLNATTSKARELGATVLREPSDVTDAGRLSQIRDPAGAIVSLWESKGHMGAGYVNEVGAWSWNELVTPAMEAAKAFYGDLFGWKAEEVQAGIPRASFSLGNLLIGGAHVPTPQEGDAPRWTVSFTVADADDSSAKAERLGGRILLPPMDIPIGRFSIVSDPSGATFTLAAVPGGSLRGVDGS